MNDDGSAESEHPTLINREIIFEEFQSNPTIRLRHRETDGQTKCDRNTALCTKIADCASLQHLWCHVTSSVM